MCTKSPAFILFDLINEDVTFLRFPKSVKFFALVNPAPKSPLLNPPLSNAQLTKPLQSRPLLSFLFTGVLYKLHPHALGPFLNLLIDEYLLLFKYKPL